jgi:hypothetical protein
MVCGKPLICRDMIANAPRPTQEQTTDYLRGGQGSTSGKSNPDRTSF